MRNISILFLMAVVLLSSCATHQSAQQDRESKNQAETQLHKTSAHSAYKANRLFEALYHWQQLNQKYPDNREFKDRIYILKKLIERRIKRHLIDADHALEQEHYDVATDEFEKVLLLDPNNKNALDGLAYVAKAAPQKQIVLLNETSQTVSVNTLLETAKSFYQHQQWNHAIRAFNNYLDANPDDPAIANYLSRCHFELGQSYQAKKMFQPAIKHMEFAAQYSNNNDNLLKTLSSMKMEAAHYYYVEGVKAAKTNRKLAISLWKKALKYNPGHFSANARLNSTTNSQNP